MSEAIKLSPEPGPAVGEWQAIVIISRVKLTTDGYSSPPELLMRRRENGGWCYRRPTADEETDYASREAW